MTVAKNTKPSTLDAEYLDAPLPEELQESESELDGILGTDFSDPVKLKLPATCFRLNNPAFVYYKSIQSKLSGWWEEFSTELDEKTGGPKYRTIRQFALVKSKVAREQEWIEQMIGPEPAAYNLRGSTRGKGVWLRVPWLGDWKARRLNGYWAPEHPAKIKALAKSLKEKLAGFEAVRSAAPFLVQMMAKYERLGEKVDQVFGGQPLDQKAGPSEANKARFYTYLEMQKSVTRIQLRLFHEWMLAHGVSINGEPVHVTQINQMLVANGQSPVGMADGMTNKDLEAVRLVKMLQLHADNFKMPLPTGEIVKKEQEPEKSVKGNGKVM
jgi:hypothetical protein